MLISLGQNWVKYFYQAIENSQALDSENGDDSEDFCSEETEDFASTQWLNFAIEYYLISAKTKDQVSINPHLNIGIR